MGPGPAAGGPALLTDGGVSSGTGPPAPRSGSGRGGPLPRSPFLPSHSPVTGGRLWGWGAPFFTNSETLHRRTAGRGGAQFPHRHPGLLGRCTDNVCEECRVNCAEGNYRWCAGDFAGANHARFLLFSPPRTQRTVLFSFVLHQTVTEPPCGARLRARC